MILIEHIFYTALCFIHQSLVNVLN